MNVHYDNSTTEDQVRPFFNLSPLCWLFLLTFGEMQHGSFQIALDSFEWNDKKAIVCRGFDEWAPLHIGQVHESVAL